MYLRMGALLILVAIVAGGLWYLFRDTPQRKIDRYRKASEYLLETLDDPTGAERFNEKILAMIPRSRHDLYVKARINERKGTLEGYRKALDTYRDLMERGGQDSSAAGFFATRICRRLGETSDARAILRSLMGDYPFQARMQLGWLAYGALDIREARYWFRQAERTLDEKEAAGGDGEGRAEVDIAVATIIEYAIGLRGAQAGAEGSSEVPDAEPLAEATEDACRLARLKLEYHERLARAGTRFEKKVVERQPEEKLLLGYIRDVCFRHARHRITPDDLDCLKTAAGDPRRHATACQRGLLLCEQQISKLPVAPSPRLLVALGALALEARREAEAGRKLDQSPGYLESVSKKAEEWFLAALGNRTPEEAKRELLAHVPPPDRPIQDGAEELPSIDQLRDRTLEERQRYVETLQDICRVLLGSDDFGRLLSVDDASPLAIGRRVADAAQEREGDEETSRSFQLYLGLAHGRGGDVDQALRAFDRFLSLAPPSARASFTIRVADLALTRLGKADLALAYLDRLGSAAERNVFFTLGEEIQLLRRIESTDGFEEQARKREDDLLAAARGRAQSPGQQFLLTRVLAVLRGRGPAIEQLRSVAEVEGADPSLRWLLADYLLAEAGQALREGGQDIALRDQEEALGLYLRLFVLHPSASTMVAARVAVLLREVDRRAGRVDLVSPLSNAFPGAPKKPLEQIATAVESFFRGKSAEALETLRIVSSSEPFEPFFSFLVGSCHLQEAHQRRAEAASDRKGATELLDKARSEVAVARKQFARYPDFPSNHYELLRLELDEISPDRDVPEDLFEQISEIAGRRELEHRGFWLHALSLRHRLVARYADLSIPNSRMVNYFQKLQGALRASIQRNPDFQEAYVALAESYFLSSELDRGLEQTAGEKRGIYRPDYGRAIETLQSVPRPDRKVHYLLGRYYQEEGRPQEAIPYQAALVLTNPSDVLMVDLLETLLQADRTDFMEKLLADAPEPAPAVTPSAEEASAGSESKTSPARRQARVEAEIEKWTSGSDSPLLERGRVIALVWIVRSALGRDPAGPEQKALRRVLRKRLQAAVLSFEGLRKYYLGQLAARRAEKSRSDGRLPAAGLAEALGHYDSSLGYWDSRKEPPPLPLLNNYAWYLLESDSAESWKKALALAQRAVGRENDSGRSLDIQDTLGWALFRNDRFTDARRVFRELLAKSDRPLYRYHLAHVLLALGDLEAAEKEIRTAVASPGKFAERSAARRLLSQIERERLRKMRKRMEEKQTTAAGA